MRESSDDTLLDRWLQQVKNNRVLAVLLFLGVVVGALASFTDSVSSLARLFRDNQTSSSPAPVVNRFETRPEQIEPGEKATLDWSVAGADSVTIDGGIGSVPLRGSRDMSPTQTTMYTVTARSGGGTVTSTATLRVTSTPLNEGTLLLNDLFYGDSGWQTPTDSAFTSSIANGRFRMEWLGNRSGQCVSRDLAIAADQDFSIQVTAQAAAPTGYELGVCWRVSGGAATYMLHVYPGVSSGGLYQLMRDETTQQIGPEGKTQLYGGSVNVLSPANVNQQFPSAAIHSGTATNVLAVARRADKIRVFLNGDYVNEGSYPKAVVDKVGIFIGGQLAAEFRDFSVRVK